MIYGMVVPGTGLFAGREVGRMGIFPHSGRCKTILTGHYKALVERIFIFRAPGLK